MPGHYDLVGIYQPQAVHHVYYELVCPGPGCDGVPVVFGFGIQTKNTVAPVGIVGLVRRHFFPVEFYEQVPSAHTLFWTKRIVHTVIDESGIRLYSSLTIQRKVERMTEIIARHCDFVHLPSALNCRIWQGVRVIGNLPEGELVR